MLAYASVRDRQSVRPTTLALIVGAHVAVIALAMVAKMEVDRVYDPPIKVVTLPKPPPPPDPTVPIEKAEPSTPISHVTTLDPIVDTDILTTFPNQVLIDTTPSGPIAGPDIGPPFVPSLDPPPVVRTKAVLKTAAADLRPPYPDSKRVSDEEATLKLRLSIDDKGRVVAVQPVGDIDRAFLNSARRHILRYWRYAPATDGGKAVHSTTTITLQFELDG